MEIPSIVPTRQSREKDYQLPLTMDYRLKGQYRLKSGAILDLCCLTAVSRSGHGSVKPRRDPRNPLFDGGPWSGERYDYCCLRNAPGRSEMARRGHNEVCLFAQTRGGTVTASLVTGVSVSISGGKSVPAETLCESHD